MADKEIREIHTTSGDSGASGIVLGLILVAILVVGGFFVWSYAGPKSTASGPSVTINAPTTGQGGGGMGGGGSSK